jgi:hypothetical protein
MQDIDYNRSTRRLFWLALVIGSIGTIAAFLWRGRPVGLGFAVGSLASLINLWVWHIIAERLGGGEDTKRSKTAGMMFAGRFLLLFAAGYVIVEYLDVDPLAAITGLFAGSAAVVAEIVIELATSKQLSR